MSTKGCVDRIYRKCILCSIESIAIEFSSAKPSGYWWHYSCEEYFISAVSHIKPYVNYTRLPGTLLTGTGVGYDQEDEIISFHCPTILDDVGYMY